MGRFFCVTAPAGRENVEGTEEQPVVQTKAQIEFVPTAPR